MSNLLNTVQGRNAVLAAQKWLLERRLSRFFKRNLVIDFNRSQLGLSEFDLSTLLGQLNVAHDDELLAIYNQLGIIGGLATSIAEADIYVDPTNGDDITGTGSSDRPYASLWFMSNLPRRINHIYRILIYGDIDMQYEELLIDMTFGEQGSLSFIGVGPAVPVLTGTEGAVTAVNASQTALMQITVDTPPNLNSVLYFLEMTSGPNVGYAVPVCRVDPATLDIYTRYSPISLIAPGNTYRFVEPDHFLTVGSLKIIARGSSDGYDFVDTNGRVNFANLNVVLSDTSGTGNRKDVCVINAGVQTTFSFCTLRGLSRTGEDQQWIKIFSDVNYTRPFDHAGIAGLCQSGIANLLNWSGAATKQGAGCLVRLIDDTPLVNWQVLYSAGKAANISCFDCCGYCYFWSFTGRAEEIWAGRIDVQRSMAKFKKVCLSDPNAFNEIAIIADSNAYFQNCVFGHGSYALALYSSRVRLATTGGDSTATFTSLVTGALIEGGSNLYLSNGAWQGTAPATDLEFGDPNPVINVAFPAAHAFQEDLFGSFCQRDN